MLGFTDEQLEQMEALGIDPYELVGLDHICRECGNEVENAGYQVHCNACENEGMDSFDFDKSDDDFYDDMPF